MLVGLHKHSDEGLHHTADQLPATRKSAFVRYMGQKCRMLLDTLEVLQKVSAAPTDAVACDEMSLLLCELLHGSQCDIYQVPSSDGQNFLKINRKVFLPVSSHGLLHRAEHTFEGDRSGKPVTYSNLDLHGERGGAAARDADRDDSVALLEWYEPRFGYRELLVRAAEQDRIAAMMRERDFEAAEGVTDWLNVLQEYKVPCCICATTAFDRSAVNHLLNRSGLQPYFEQDGQISCVAAEDGCETVEQGYLVASIKVRRPPMRCVVFENDPVGVVAAHEATSKVVALLSSAGAAQGGASPSPYSANAADLRHADLRVSGLEDLSLMSLRELFKGAAPV